MLTDIYDIQSYAVTLTEHAKTRDGKRISVSFEDGIPAPYTTRGEDLINIVLPTLNIHLTDRDSVLARWYMIHEIAHQTEGPEAFDILNKHKLDPTKTPIGALFNLFEDGRIERKQSEKFEGDRKTFSDAFDIMMQDGKWEERDLSGLEKDGENMLACMMAEMESRSDWNWGAAKHLTTLQSLVPEDVTKKIELLRDNDIIKDLQQAETPYCTFDLAKKAYELLWEKNDDEELEKMQEGDVEGKPEEGDGNGEGDRRSGDETEQGCESCNEEPKDGEKGDGEAVVKYDDFLKSKHERGDVHPETMEGGAVKFDYSTYDSSKYGSYVPTELKDVCVIDWKKPLVNEQHPAKYSISSHKHYQTHALEKIEKVKARHGSSGKALSNKVRRHLQVLSQAGYKGAQKKGRIHKKNIYRVGVPKIGNGEWNSKVFRTRHIRDITDTAVCLLVDLSGSMGSRSKFEHACIATAMLNDAISTSTHIPVQILGFSDWSVPVVSIIKHYDERASEREILERFAEMEAYMAGNPDGEAIMWAYHYLKQRKEKRKLLITLSDGEPASYSSWDDYAYAKRVIEDIEKEGLVELSAIGILDNTVKTLYSNCCVINKANELEGVLLDLIKRKVITTEGK